MATVECERVEDDVLVVRLHGPFLTEEDAALVREGLLDTSAADARCVVLNWSDARIVNTLTIGAVLWSARQLEARGRTWRSCALPARVHDALGGIRTAFHWHVDDSETESIRSWVDARPAGGAPTGTIRRERWTARTTSNSVTREPYRSTRRNMGAVATERVGDAWVVRLSGHFLTEEEATLVRESLLDPQGADARCVVVNWAQVRFVNTMMIGAVIWCAREILARGGGYRNCELPARVNYALRSIRKVFDWHYYDTEADAIHSCVDGGTGAPEAPEPTP